MAAVIPDRTVRHRLGVEDLVRYTLVVLFAAILYLFVLYPLLQVIWRSLLANDGTFVGWANYRRYFGTPAIAQSISNSLFVSIVSMAITVVLALVYAYGLTRTRMRGRGLFRLVAMLPLFAPSLVQALAFIYVFGNNGILTRTTGLNVGIYGAKGIVLAEVFYCFPHVLLIPAVLAFLVDRVVQRRRYALVTSSSQPLTPRRRPAADWGAFAYCALVAGAIAGMYLAILVYSLVARWPYNFTPTLRHYRFDTVGGYAPLWNSVYVAALTAVVGTVLTFVGAYVVVKCRATGSGLLYLLSVLPVSIPGMVLGLAYIFTFNAAGSVLNALYGTLAILIVSNVIHYFTVGFLTATTALRQMDGEFENVSASLGVPFYRTFWRVTVPMALPSIVAISMYFFLNAMVTLSAVVFLVAPGTELAAVAVLLMD